MNAQRVLFSMAVTFVAVSLWALPAPTALASDAQNSQSKVQVRQVLTDLENDQLLIVGRGFLYNGEPRVKIGGKPGRLELIEYSDEEVVAVLPRLPDGDYRLKIWSGKKASSDVYFFELSLRKPNPAFFSGILADIPIEDCLINEVGLNCDTKKVVHIAVPRGASTVFDIVNQKTVQVDGQPTLIDETTSFELVNQQAPDRPGYVTELVYKKGQAIGTAQLSRDEPHFAIHDVEAGFNFKASLVNDEQVVLTLDADTHKQVQTESIAGIVTASIDPDSWSDDGRNAELLVGIQNFGDITTEYVLTVTGFNGASAVRDFRAPLLEQVPETLVMKEQVTASRKNLGSGEQHLFRLGLHAENGFLPGDEFLVSLSSQTGRLYDELLVEF